MRAALASLSLLLLMPACADEHYGHLELRRDDTVVRTFEPCTCASGDPHFFGVDMTDNNDAQLRYSHFAVEHVPGIMFFSPNSASETFFLGPDACTRFDGELREQGRSADTMKGSVTLDCTLDSGLQIVGQLSFEDCHVPDDDD